MSHKAAMIHYENVLLVVSSLNDFILAMNGI